MTEDLTAAAARLVEVLAAENAALAAVDLPRAGAMLAAKTSAAEAFVAAHAALRGASQATSHGTSHGAWSGARPVVLERLRDLVEENQRLLDIAIKVQGRVLGVIARALPRALRDPATTRYGAQGRVAPARPSAFAISARA
jgi:hypothetical protein